MYRCVSFSVLPSCANAADARQAIATAIRNRLEGAQGETIKGMNEDYNFTLDLLQPTILPFFISVYYILLIFLEHYLLLIYHYHTEALLLVALGIAVSFGVDTYVLGLGRLFVKREVY